MPTGLPTTNSTNKYPNVKQLSWAINYQWVGTWNAHLGDRATPGKLIDAIIKKSLAEATQLKDQIKREFKLGT